MSTEIDRAVNAGRSLWSAITGAGPAPTCPILSLLVRPQTISGTVHLNGLEASTLVVGHQVVACA